MLDLGEVVVDEEQLDPVPARCGEQMGEPRVTEDVASLVECQKEPRLQRAALDRSSALGLVDDRGNQGREVRRVPITLGAGRDDEDGPGFVEQGPGCEATGVRGL